ncbi:ABC transporter related protein [Thermocrinis albus DSM 14484]|uniref:ABC transporter related protein n=1 Tax=Thermocrinis albus (strain DSM 14484 / JCM 11386 / HI 11/12) TaxID=638303 RepID=D3SP32_THEAH|nr:ABC transporter ATP-binding protein [Thermocrinis albus]ADC88919.1 ABC transporter related protein [Thermocrinis albus DSM 14484]
MSNVKWLLFRFKKHWVLLLLALLGSLFESVGVAGVSLLVKRLVDGVFLMKSFWKLVQTVGYLYLLVLLGQLGNFMVSYFTGLMAEREVREIREQAFEKLMGSHYLYVKGISIGDVLTRLLSDLRLYRDLVGSYAVKLFRDPFTVILLLAVLFYRDWRLTLLLALFLPVMFFSIRYFGGKKDKHTKKLQEDTADAASGIKESLRGVETIKAFMAEKVMIGWFQQQSRKLYERSIKLVLYSSWNTVFNYLFGYTVVSLLIFYGGYMVVKGYMTPGDFISYLTALVMLQKPLMEVQKGFTEVRGSISVVSRLREVLNLPQERDEGYLFRGLKEEIRIEDLRVKLGDEDILRHITLRIKAGQKVGIIGSTGSGKSTFLRTLAGFVPYMGKILLDGVDLSLFKPSSFRSNIGFLTQESFVLSGSVRDNLLIAKRDATEEEMWRALRMALCDFVTDLDEKVGEGGRDLSGGEKQRLALARLFLKEPSIIFLDEPTSALDTVTEQQVLKNILMAFPKATVFMVAHRPSSLSICDRVLVMEDGQIVFDGDVTSALNFFTSRR